MTVAEFKDKYFTHNFYWVTEDNHIALQVIGLEMGCLCHNGKRTTIPWYEGFTNLGFRTNTTTDTTMFQIEHCIPHTEQITDYDAMLSDYKGLGSDKLNFIIPIVVFPFDVMVSFGETDDEITGRLLDYGVSEDDIELALFSDLTSTGRTAMLSGNQTVMRFRFTPNNDPEDAGIIQHEIFHCASLILDKVGIPLSIGVSDEIYAYLIGYLTTEIMRNLNNKKLKMT